MCVCVCEGGGGGGGGGGRGMCAYPFFSSFLGHSKLEHEPRYPYAEMTSSL